MPAYWALDPSGVEHLSAEEATELGFPELQFSAELFTVSWDPSVYTGLREFHQAKGFDPYSQDIARYPGYTLYRPSMNMLRSLIVSAFSGRDFARCAGYGFGLATCARLPRSAW
ncbi:hypothetical protein DFH06DRAFT_976601 [Mycena polygramma]|nr:hypothetical protein DFH06DRAFT_976601 [Mycena polygramma]